MRVAPGRQDAQGLRRGVWRRPYVDQIAPGVFVCTEGCGTAAKPSDAIGRLGARQVRQGAWADLLPAADFR